MITKEDYISNDEIAWCPGCGDFGILNAVKQALVELNLEPYKVLIVSGIGQAAKLPHYLKCNTFNGLHGRTLPVATGIKTVNNKLTVIAVGGDGDGYAEGGNHFIHAMRRNPDIAYLVHNNQIYGLTKGQASPTSDINLKTGTTPFGNFNIPENPLALAVAANCSFVARGFSGDVQHLAKLIKEAISHKGFSLVDILQPCPTYNKLNTFQWYRERVYKLDDDKDYNFSDKIAAFKKAQEWGEKIPIGIIYKVERPTFEDNILQNKDVPLVHQPLEIPDVQKLLERFI
ncbi:MAG: 2-oxoacid:ferredoxin oxidoreductase subunit beta [Candidatus Firestonebacteria bacterium]